MGRKSNRDHAEDNAARSRGLVWETRTDKTFSPAHLVGWWLDTVWMGTTPRAAFEAMEEDLDAWMAKTPTMPEPCRICGEGPARDEFDGTCGWESCEREAAEVTESLWLEKSTET